jgi:hypothetical protein
MEVYEFGQLSKRPDRIGFFWILYSANGEHSMGSDIGLLDVLNELGKDGWHLGTQLNNIETMQIHEMILQRRVL